MEQELPAVQTARDPGGPRNSRLRSSRILVIVGALAGRRTKGI